MRRTPYHSFYKFVAGGINAQTQRIIAKTNKPQVRKIIELAIEHEGVLLRILKIKGINDILIKYERSQLDNAVSAVVKAMDLFSDVDISVLSKVRYDFIIKTNRNFFPFNSNCDSWDTDTHTVELSRDKDCTAAIQAFSGALNIKGLPENLYNSVRSYFEAGNFDDAIKDYQGLLITIDSTLEVAQKSLEAINTLTALSSGQNLLHQVNNQNANITVDALAKGQLNLNTEPWKTYSRNIRYNGLAEYASR